MPSGLVGQAANGLLGSVAEEVGVNPDELRLGVPVTNSDKKAERAVAGKSSKENDPGGSAAPKPYGPKVGSQPGPILHPRAVPPVVHSTP